MTFDREPDLDNANVGMPDNRNVFAEATKLGCFRFLRVKQSHATGNKSVLALEFVPCHMTSNTNEETQSVFEFVSASHADKAEKNSILSLYS